MVTDHKHQNEGLRCFSGSDLTIADAIPRIVVGQTDQCDHLLISWRPRARSSIQHTGTSICDLSAEEEVFSHDLPQHII